MDPSQLNDEDVKLHFPRLDPACFLRLVTDQVGGRSLSFIGIRLEGSKHSISPLVQIPVADDMVRRHIRQGWA